MAAAAGLRFDTGRGLRRLAGPAAFVTDPKRFLVEHVARNGRASAFRIGRRTFYVFTAPELVEQILVRSAAKYDKGPVLKNLKEFFGEGIFTAEGEAWRERRRTLTPVFSREMLPKHERDVARTTATWIDRRLAASPRAGFEIDAYDAMMELTREIMLQVLFGDRVSEEDTLEALAAGRAFDEVNRFFQYTLTLGGALLHRLPGLRRWKYLRAVATLDRTIEKYLRLAGDGSPGLVSLLRAGERDDRAVRDHLLTLYFGGHESTASTLTSALWMMMSHPEPLARLTREARAGDGKTRDLDAFLHETLRLYPPVWCMARRAIAGDTVHHDGAAHAIAPGALVFIPTWCVHRDPESYAAPELFDPSRWDGVDPSTRRRGTYLPFGLGPRMCIGAGVAWMELRAILTALLRRFDLAPAAGTTPPPYETTGALTIRPTRPLRISLRHA